MFFLFKSRLLHHSFHPPVDFVGRHVFDMGGHGPNMAERVFERRRSVAVELICQRTLHFGACFDRLCHDFVDVFDIQADTDAGTAGRLRRQRLHLRAFVGEKWGRKSATTRATRISYLRSFFSWAENEELIADDPARRIKRPPKRKPDVYRPDETEIALLLNAATTREVAPLLLMSGAGLRAAELCTLVWADVDLTRGRARIRRKGRHWQYLPIDPLIVGRLRAIYRSLEPDPDDHVFVAETERWVSQERRVRRVIDPKTPRAPKTLWTMVTRVSRRAGVRPVGPHALRHGFANAFLRQTRDRFGTADVRTLQLLMGHSRIDTTEQYMREIEAQDAADVLARLRAEDVSQSGGVEGHPHEWPSSPEVEAAGIEPASAPAGEDQASGTEPDEPRGSHERRRARQQGRLAPEGRHEAEPENGS